MHDRLQLLWRATMRPTLEKPSPRSKRFIYLLLCLSCVFPLILTACRLRSSPKIAIIPQTEGEVFWDSVHFGAEAAAKNGGASIYWNAPSREDDVEAQIALVQNVVKRNYQGLVLAPNHCLALISPVRDLMSRGIPISIIGSALSIPPSPDVTSIINDDEMGGRLAAQRAAVLLHGRGNIAVLGIDPDFLGNLSRARAFESELARIAPDISIVERGTGTFNVPHEQQVAQELLKTHPDLDLIVAFMWRTAEGVIRTLNSTKDHKKVILIAFDAMTVPPFDQSNNLDSVIEEDIRTMGERGTEAVIAKLRKQPTPSLVVIPPRLITRENINSREVHDMFPAIWQTGDWPRGSIR